MTSRETTQFLPRSDAEGWPEGTRRSLSDIAHLIAIGAVQWPWLLRSLSGGTKAAKQRLLDRLDLAPDALPNLGSWKADTGFLHLIVDHILEHQPETVLELGTGASSLIIAKALQRAGRGKLISCDQHADFVAATREWLHENGVEAELRATPLRPAPGGWPGIWYDHGSLPDRVDLLVIDGPPWTIHPYVRGAAETLFDRISVGGKILLDDGARPGERIIARKWRRNWPDFEFRLVHAGTKGTLIGTRLR
ncbi:class I SAM-dependent methyltransferase [Stakelama tenebrarum]|uniref:Class I SAM-dependent methyltransferase n=1 Tax=Stakelama tenebrarum TaxID=2711215 RepID=A0A6G6Y3W5_9SPHN|nr:class I SAM-dependent methyltransferase [Sphingosinithalassobacter tenebrarum]QIG79605.1 class I SAM-dependent methyltransferase [Sphingosinithalassobacter tenebrarum]